MTYTPRSPEERSSAPRGLPTGSFEEWAEWSAGEKTTPRLTAVEVATGTETLTVVAAPPTRLTQRLRAHRMPLMAVTALIVIAQIIMRSVNPWQAPTPDSQEYLALARDIAQGVSFMNARRTPGYPLFIDAVYAVGGWGNLGALVTAQTALAVLTVFGIYLLSWRLSRRPWLAAAVAGLCAINPYLFDYVFVVRDEAFSTFLLVIYFLLVERIMALWVSGRREERARTGRDWLWLVGLILLSVVLILTRPALITLPATVLLIALAIALWRRRDQWRKRMGGLAFTLVAVYALIVGYMAWNRVTNDYFGISYIGGVNVFGRILNHHQGNLSVSPQFQAAQRNLLLFEQEHSSSAWTFATQYGYTGDFYATLTGYGTNFIERHPAAYLSAALEDLPRVWMVDPWQAIRQSFHERAFSVIRDIGFVSLKTYALLPLILLWVAWRLWRERDNHVLQMQLVALLSVIGMIVVLSLTSYNEFFRLRSPLDWSYLMVEILAFWDVTRFFWPRFAPRLEPYLRKLGKPGERIVAALSESPAQGI